MSPEELVIRKRALRELERNPLWIGIIAPALAKLEGEMLYGLSKRDSTSEQRSTFLEGYHAARDIRHLADRERDLLKREQDALERDGSETDLDAE